MKTTSEIFSDALPQASGKIFRVNMIKLNLNLNHIRKILFLISFFFLNITFIEAQTVSGNWDAANTNGTPGYQNHGNGVIQLVNTANTGCSGAAVHETSVKYDPTSGANFNQCYRVFFGCPGNDDIGSDTKGDGMAFSFSKCAYNINNGACGGGLGYHGACAQMITVEFDTWSSQCNSNFDCNYGGGNSGANDEVAIHRNGDASDVGRLTSVNAGNLEDGAEHIVCISYTFSTKVLTVTIDGNTIINYTYDLGAYFGAGGLNQTWSSGKFGATNPTIVTDNSATGIAATIGSPLCPAGVVMTSPTVFGVCDNPKTLTASATPPAGNTVTYVEFFVNGISVGTDNTAPYSVNWGNPAFGNYQVTAVAHYSGGSNSTSSIQNVTVADGIYTTATAPVIDGNIDAMWSNHASFPLNKVSFGAGNISGPADLSASFKVARDATYLYVLVDVTDANQVKDSPVGENWKDDKVEVYIDFGNDKPSTYGGNDHSYGFVWSDNAVYVGPGNATGVTFAQTTKPGNTGYIMEIRFPWSTLGGIPAAGSFIGFEVQVNDDDDGGDRDSKIAWEDATDNAWNNPSRFGTLQIAGCSNPMPVKLLSFTGRVMNGSAMLSWRTEGEINNEKFIIERLNGFSDWEVIGEISGAGNFSALIDYSFTDYAPLDGVAYYRLRQVDFDGGYAYSNIVAVETLSNKVNIGPNPFSDILLIKGAIKGEADIRIYDLLGRLVFYLNKKSENGMLSIEPDLAAGTYLIAVQSEDFIEQQKIVKK